MRTVIWPWEDDEPQMSKWLTDDEQKLAASGTEEQFQKWYRLTVLRRTLAKDAGSVLLSLALLSCIAVVAVVFIA